jgi:hypothetical protein
VLSEPADALMTRRLAGAHCEGIGRFSAEPASGRWSWSDAVYEIFGYQDGSVPPTWSLIVSHIPPADRGAAQAGYQLACSRVGPFSWSQRIQVGENHPLDPGTWGNLPPQWLACHRAGGLQRHVGSSLGHHGTSIFRAMSST